MPASNQVSERVCPRCFGDSGVAGGPCNYCAPRGPPRCAFCGSTTWDVSSLCSDACRVALAVEFALGQAAYLKALDDKAQEEAIEQAGWKRGRDFGRGN
jgi:hypothetical protein